MDLLADLLHFGASDFPSKNPFKKRFKIVFFPQQQNALGSSAIVKVSEQTGAAPKPIPPRFPGSK